MGRLAIRGAIALTAAFVIFPFLFMLMMGASTADELFGDGLMMIFFQFILPFPFWLIPLVLGSIAGLLWHCIAELLRADDESPAD